MKKLIVIIFIISTQFSFAGTKIKAFQKRVNKAWLKKTEKRYMQTINYYQNISNKFNKDIKSKKSTKIPKDLQEIIKFFDIKKLPKLRAIKTGHISKEGPFQIYLNPIGLAYKKYSVSGYEFTFRGKTGVEIRQNIIKDLSLLFKNKSSQLKKTSFLDHFISQAIAKNFRESDGEYIGYRYKLKGYQSDRNTRNKKIDPNWPLKKRYMNSTESKVLFSNGEMVHASDDTERFVYRYNKKNEALMYKSVMVLYAVGLEQMTEDPFDFCAKNWNTDIIDGTCGELLTTKAAEKKITKYVESLLLKCEEQLPKMQHYIRTAPSYVDRISYNDINPKTGKPIPYSQFHQQSFQLGKSTNVIELATLAHMMTELKQTSQDSDSIINNHSKDTINKYFPEYANSGGLLDCRNRQLAKNNFIKRGENYKSNFINSYGKKTKFEREPNSKNLRDDRDGKKYDLYSMNYTCTMLYELKDCVSEFSQAVKNVDRVYNKYKKSAVKGRFPSFDESPLNYDMDAVIKEINEK